MAQLTAIRQKLPPTTVVFNSPGIGDLPIKQEDYSFIHNFNSRDGSINKVGKTIGEVTDLNVKAGEQPPPSKMQLLDNGGLIGMGEKAGKQHAIADVIEALKQAPEVAKKAY